MKKLLIICITLMIYFTACTNTSSKPNFGLGSANGNDYYFSNSGSDAGNGSISNPYKSITKANALNLQPGDRVLFNRGDLFFGSLTPKNPGTVSQPIIYGAYGTGSKPIITGLTDLTNWTSAGGGKYETTLNFVANLNILTLNDVQQEMGRTPNSNNGNGGYNNFESHSANSSISDAQLTGAINYKDAELVVRTNRYIIDRVKITNHSGTTLSYSPALSYEPNNNFGYFIQNDIRTLDQLGEWHYNYITRKLTVFFGTANPAAYDVKASTVQNVIFVYDDDNIIFDNLDIKGGNQYSVYLYSGANVTVQNCDITFSGIDGIVAGNMNNLRVENCNIRNSNNTGINLNNSSYGIIRNNQINKTGIFTGLGQAHGNKSLGIRETGNHNLIEFNTVDSTGYMGIRFGGDYTTIKNNFVNYFNLTKDDGGGIYTSDIGTQRKIIGNIVLNGIGAPAGTSSNTFGSTYGIYLDDFANNVEVSDNTVANCSKSGILIHNASRLTLTGNTVFNNASQQLLFSHNLTRPNAMLIRNVIFKHNTLFSKTANQGAINLLTVKNDVSLTAGLMDSNFYCRPLDDNYIFHTQYIDNTGKQILQDLDLPLWQDFYAKDIHSYKTATKIIDHKFNSYIGVNRFANGRFNVSIVGVNFGSTGTASKSWNSSKLDDGTLQIAINSSKPSISTATIPVLAVSNQKKYIVKFTAVCSKDTMLYVYARQGGAPYKVLSNNGAKTIVNITQNRKDYTVAFQPEINNSLTSIFFETPMQQGTFWLDNIEIYEADLTLTNPDDSIRLEYNATQDVQVYPLPGKYIDPRGILYNGEISLEPYTSAVLIRIGDIYIPPVEPIDTIPTVVLLNSDYDVTIPPPTVHLTAIAKAHFGVRKVEFLNGIKVVHTEWTPPYNFSWINIPVGTYSFTARVQDKHLNQVKSAPVLVIVIKTQ